MKGKEVVMTIGVLLAAVLGATGSTQGQTDTGVKYVGVGVARAGDIVYPMNARRPGMVTLDVSVDDSGGVQKVQAMRDVPPLTSAAENGVKNWKFTPALIGGQAVAGTARINVVFNPFNPGDVSIPNKPLPPAESAGGGGNGEYRCADVKTAKYAVYPANTVASGTVVLDVKVGADGKVEGTRVLRGVGVLSAAATGAIKNWEFVAASYEGKAVESHEVVAFVFVSPAVGTM